MTVKLWELLSSMPRNGQWVLTAPATKHHPESDRQIFERRALSALKRVVKRLELTGHLHTFRHTFVSQALMRGVPEPVVREWVGHVDPEIIRLYTHVSDDLSQQFVARFSAAGQPDQGQAAGQAGV